MADADSSPGWRALQESRQEMYDEITERIRDALDRLRDDSPPCKPTQKSLAELAGVSRRTLHNREWPVEELKRIKKEQSVAERESSSERKEQPGNASHSQIEGESTDSGSGNKSAPSGGKDQSKSAQNDGEVDSIEDLREKIVNYQKENLQLFYETEDLREEVEQLQRQCEMLISANEQLRREKNQIPNGRRENGRRDGRD